jgi:hypothetical protein
MTVLSSITPASPISDCHESDPRVLPERVRFTPARGYKFEGTV